jgi:hypothetical protein
MRCAEDGFAGSGGASAYSQTEGSDAKLLFVSVEMQQD